MRAHTSGHVTLFVTMREMECAGVRSYLLQGTMWAMQWVPSSRKTYSCQILKCSACTSTSDISAAFAVGLDSWQCPSVHHLPYMRNNLTLALCSLRMLLFKSASCNKVLRERERERAVKLMRKRRLYCLSEYQLRLLRCGDIREKYMAAFNSSRHKCARTWPAYISYDVRV
jgi:hypothetical protein